MQEAAANGAPSPLPVGFLACPPLTTSLPFSQDSFSSSCVATAVGASDAESDAKQRRGKGRKRRCAGGQLSRPHDAGVHIEAVLSALEALQSHSSAPTTTLTQAGMTNNSEAWPSASCTSAFTIRDGAAAWMCSRLELMWESVANATSSMFPTECVPKSAKEQHATKRIGGSVFCETMFPSSSRPVKHGRSEHQRNNCAAACSTVKRDQNASDVEVKLGSEDDYVLRVGRARSRLIVRLLALDALHTGRRRQRRQKRSSVHHENTSHGALLTESKTSAQLGEQYVTAATGHPKGASAVVHQWLWQRAAGLPRRVGGHLFSSSSLSLHGELSSLLLEWLSLELEDAKAESEAARKSTVETKASPKNTPHDVPIASAIEEKQLLLRSTCPTLSPNAAVRAEPQKNNGEDIFLCSFTNEVDGRTEDPAAIDMATSPETEGKCATQLTERAVVNATPPLHGTDVLRPPVEAEARLVASAASPYGLPPAVRGPALRILRLGAVPVRVKPELNAEEAVTPVCTTDSISESDALPVHDKDNETSKEGEDSPNPSVGAVHVIRLDEEKEGSSIAEGTHSSGTDGSNLTRDGQGSLAAGGPQRFAIQLIRRTTPRLPFTALDNDDSEEAERLLPFKKDGIVFPDVAITAEVNKEKPEEKVENTKEKLRSLHQTHPVPKEPTITVAETTDRDISRAARQARWRRFAPFIFYAPRGSTTERSVRTILRALGFFGRSLSQSKASGRIKHEAAFRSTLPLFLPPLSSTLEHVESSQNRRTTLLSSPLASTIPLCPLGRLPPLLVTYAWMREAALRAAWMSHIAGVSTGHAPTLNSSSVRSDKQNDTDVTTALYSGPSSAPCAGESTATNNVPTPLNTLRGTSIAAAVSADASLSASLLSTATDQKEDAHAEHTTFLPCVALADGRVAAALDDVLRAPLSTADLFGKEPGLDPATTAQTKFCLTAAFERNLYAYMCYSIAGVAASHPEATATAVTEGKSSPLTVADWEAYLDFRYGASARRRRKLSRAGKTTVAAVASTTELTWSGDQVTHQAKTCTNHSVQQNTPVQHAQYEAAPSLSSSTAASVAACYVARSSPVYASVMDLAAALFCVELRRACEVAVEDILHKLRTNLISQNVKQDNSSSTGNNHALYDDAIQSSFSACTRAVLTDEGTTAAVTLPSVASLPSMQLVLEGALEVDASLCWYVHQTMCSFWTVPRPTHDKHLSPLCPCCMNSANEFSHVNTPGSVGTTAAAATSTNVPTTAPAYAATLWLGLATVLSIGESGIAQYVRSVLLPPTCLQSSVSKFTTATTADKLSLAPFTMPTLFRSTLEDLYREEALLRGRPILPLCVPHRQPTKYDLPKTERRTVAAGLVLPGDEATRAELVEREETSLAVAVAVALRHPRLLLRQVHFLWCLSSDAVSSITGQEETKKRSIQKLQTHQQEQQVSKSNNGVDGYRKQDYYNGEAEDRVRREEFSVRMSSLVECMQIAACVGGLPAPLATSLTSATSHIDEPQHAAGGQHVEAATAAVDTTSKATNSPQEEGKAAVPSEEGRRNATAMKADSAAGDEQNALHPSPPPSPPPRPRLQLRLTTTAPTAATSTPAVSLSATKNDVINARKRRRSSSLPRADDCSSFHLPEEAQEDAGIDTFLAAVPLPPLDVLSDTKVRWGLPFNAATASSRTTATAAPAAIPLVTLVSNVLWDALRYIAACQPKTPRQFKPTSSLAVASAAAEGGVIRATCVGGLPVIAHNDGLQRGVPTSATRPLRRTLALRLPPAYAELQRLWHALRPFPLVKHNPKVSEHTSAKQFGGGEGAVLEVLLPSATNSAVPNGRQDKGQADVTHVDLRHYDTLTTSLRGVVGVTVGYAVYAVLHRIMELWRCSAGEMGLGVDWVAGAKGSSSGVALFSSPLQTLRIDPTSCQENYQHQQQQGQQPATSSELCFASSDGGTSLDLLIWLAAQLRTFHDDVLQPLNRVCAVHLNQRSQHHRHHVSSTDFFSQQGEGEAKNGASFSSDHYSPFDVTAAWLSYRPLAQVLFPALVRCFDTAFSSISTDAKRQILEQKDTGKGSFVSSAERKHGAYCIVLPLRNPCDRGDVEKAEQEARAMWMGVRRSLQKAGVTLPDAPRI